jgi:hypothetical protein
MSAADRVLFGVEPVERRKIEHWIDRYNLVIGDLKHTPNLILGY